MLTKMSARQARDNFTDVLGSVYYGRQPIAVEKKGRIFAIVMNPEEYEDLKQAAKAQFFEIVDNIQKKNKGITEEQVRADIDPIIDEVRKAYYDKE